MRPAGSSTPARASSRRGSPSCGSSRWWWHNRPGAGGVIGTGNCRARGRRRIHDRHGQFSTPRGEREPDEIAALRSAARPCARGAGRKIAAGADGASVGRSEDGRRVRRTGEASPGKFSFGSSGSRWHAPSLLGEMFRMLAGIDIAHVPYKGGAPAGADLLCGPHPDDVRADLTRRCRRSGRAGCALAVTTDYAAADAAGGSDLRRVRAIRRWWPATGGA